MISSNIFISIYEFLSLYPNLMNSISIILGLIMGASAIKIIRQDAITFSKFVKHELHIKFFATIFIAYILYNALSNTFVLNWALKYNNIITSSIFGILSETIVKQISSDENQVKMVHWLIRLLANSVHSEIAITNKSKDNEKEVTDDKQKSNHK